MLMRLIVNMGNWCWGLIGRFDHALESLDRWSMKNKSSFRLTLLAGNALVKFCEDHGRGETELRHLLEKIEAGDAEAARRVFRSIPWSGGMMTFSDWIPPVVFESETPEYVDCVFGALTERFCRVAVDLLDIDLKRK